VKGALFLGAGIVLHRLHSVNETWLHGRGKHLRVTGAVFTLAALGLADLPPFGTFLGKGWITDSADRIAGGPWLPVLLSAIFCACTALTGAAVLRFAGGVFCGLGDPPSEDPQMAAEANEETGESESGRQRTPLTMIVPMCALAALGVAAGIAAMVPRAAAAIESAAVRFEDQPAYLNLVLHGVRTARPTGIYPAVSPDVTAASVITALCSVAAAILLALAALYWRRLPVLRGGYEPGAGLVPLIRAFQSGVINDYITWLVAGVAALGGILALIVR
jgi:multicomponent Na+:H+ antiporter subunit D